MLFAIEKVVTDVLLSQLVVLTILTLATFYIKKCKKNASAFILLSILSKKNSSNIKKKFLLARSLK